jgi:DNA-binding CsgD family transcriptional regulator
MAGHLAADVARGYDDAAPRHQRLSSREFEVFRLIAGGKSLTEIGETLHISIKTVSTYRTRIMEKARFHSNADIVAYAIHNHLIE